MEGREAGLPGGRAAPGVRAAGLAGMLQKGGWAPLA